MGNRKVCYTLECPKNLNCHCNLTYDEVFCLTQHFKRTIYCLTVTKDGLKNFTFENDPNFLEYCEYLDSLKVMEKLEGDKDEMQRK